MYGNVSVNDCIEELDLTVCSYKLLRKYGCSLVSDILSIPLKSLWYEVCNKSRESFREILTKLNDVGYRFPECSAAEYPDLQKALPLIIQKASDVQAKPPKKKLSYSLPLGTIDPTNECGYCYSHEGCNSLSSASEKYFRSNSCANSHSFSEV